MQKLRFGTRWLACAAVALTFSGLAACGPVENYTAEGRMDQYLLKNRNESVDFSQMLREAPAGSAIVFGRLKVLYHGTMQSKERGNDTNIWGEKLYEKKEIARDISGSCQPHMRQEGVVSFLKPKVDEAVSDNDGMFVAVVKPGVQFELEPSCPFLSTNRQRLGRSYLMGTVNANAPTYIGDVAVVIAADSRSFNAQATDFEKGALGEFRRKAQWAGATQKQLLVRNAPKQIKLF